MADMLRLHRLADEQPQLLQAALRALLHAAAYCDQPAHAPEVAAILAQPHYLDLPAEIIATSLPGADVRRAEARQPDADTSVFFANAANFPWRSHALWFLQQMRRWGYVGSGVELANACASFRPDLYANAAASIGLPVPSATAKSEGRHAETWSLPAAPLPIAMGPDRFLDGAYFAPDELQAE